jgi:hypothetical protein
MDQAQLTPELRAVLPEDFKSQEELFKTFGALRSVELVEQLNKDTHQTLRYRLTYDLASVLLRLSRNGDGRVEGISSEEIDESPQ